MPLRIDTATIGKARKTDAGFLIAPASLTRTGVFQYRNPNGSIRRELRHPDDVFNRDSLDSYALMPITDDHPDDEYGVTADTAARYQAGTVGQDVRRADDGKHIDATVCVTRATTIKRIDSGKVELSPGYNCDLEEVPGTYEGQHYDARQRNIRVNHVAVVDRGRAGHSARIHMDTADAVCVDSGQAIADFPAPLQPPEAQPMKRKIKVDGVEIEVEGAVADQIEAAQARTASDAKARADAALAASEKARKDAEDAAKAADKARKDMADNMPALVQARRDLEVTASKLLGAEFKVDGIADGPIKLAIAKVHNPAMNLDSADVATVEVLYSAARADAAATVSGPETGDDEGESSSDDKDPTDPPKTKGAKSSDKTQGKSTTVGGRKDAAQSRADAKRARATETAPYDGAGSRADALPSSVRRDSAGFVQGKPSQVVHLDSEGAAELGDYDSARAVFMAQQRDLGMQPLDGMHRDQVMKGNS
jgi:hypothetical protein